MPLDLAQVMTSMLRNASTFSNIIPLKNNKPRIRYDLPSEIGCHKGINQSFACTKPIGLQWVQVIACDVMLRIQSDERTGNKGKIKKMQDNKELQHLKFCI